MAGNLGVGLSRATQYGVRFGTRDRHRVSKRKPATISAESDHFAGWLDSCCDLDGEYYEYAAVLFGSWNAYLKPNAENPKKTARSSGGDFERWGCKGKNPGLFAGLVSG